MRKVDCSRQIFPAFFCLLVFLSHLETATSLLPNVQNFRTATSTKLASFRIRSKKRGRVVYDPKTGFYRPERKEENKSSKQNSIDGSGAWDSFKSVVYKGIDGAAALPDKIKEVVAGNEVDAGIYEGYRDVQQRVYQDKTVTPPVQRLAKEAKAHSPFLGDDDRSKNNIFDTLKGAFYSSVDMVLNEPALEKKKEASESFTPSVKQNAWVSEEFKSVLPDLQSENPITSSMAEWKLGQWERQQRRRQLAVERDEVALKVKESVFEAGDIVLSTAESLSKLPGQLGGFMERAVSFLASLPELIKKQIDAMIGLPTKIQQAATEVRTSVQTKVDAAQSAVQTTLITTQKTVKDVQDYPNKVKKAVKDAQAKVNEVKDVLDDTVTTGKVLLGIEKAKPRPPKSPPPQPHKKSTVSNIAWSLAGGVVSAVGKTGWWVTKGTATLAFNGVKAAVAKTTESVKEKDMSTEASPITEANATESNDRSTSISTRPPISSLKTLPLLESGAANISPGSVPEHVMLKQQDLRGMKEEPRSISARKESQIGEIDKQVADALQLAEEALKLAEEKEPK